jgi:hypothetical protein
VFWFRSALLYLGVTALIGGTIWLFWGKAIETEWKKITAANPQVKRAQADVEKKTKKALPKEISVPVPPGTATIEWNKAKSGTVSLLDLHTQENRREMQTALSAHEQRTLEILTTLRIKRPAPTMNAPQNSAAAPNDNVKPAVVTEPDKPRKTKKLKPII